MQLSKREFSKLSANEQLKLMKAKKQQQKRKPGSQARPLARGSKAKNQGSSRNLTSNPVGVSSAYAKGISGNEPSITYKNNGKECRVVHKEFITNLTGSTLFTVVQFLQLNPGLVQTFPWLANIANNFETYRCNRMKFCYLTRTGTNIPGSVLMAPDYDASDTQAVSEQILSNYQGIAEDAPWKDICCALTQQGMHNLGPRKFVRATPPPANADVKTYDIGTFTVATVDGSAVNWGKLWVEYDFTFYEPQLNPSGPAIFLGGLISGGGALSAANPIGTVPVIDPQSSGFTVDNASNITFTLSGTVVVTQTLVGTTVVSVTFTPGNGAALIAGTSSGTVNAGGTQDTSSSCFTVVAGSTLAVTSTAASVTSIAIRIGVAPVGSQA